MTETSLAQQLAEKQYLGWRPDTEDWLQALAVIAGDKPASYVAVFEDETDRVNELQALARQHGCKTVIYTVPHFTWYGSERSLDFTKGLFIYRDDKSLEDYTRLIHQDYTGKGSIEDYHRLSGKIFGYDERAIEAFISDPSNLSPHSRADVLEYIEKEAPPAIYDQLAKDPIFRGILPQRKHPQIFKD